MSNSEIVDYIKKSFELRNQGFYKPAIEMLYKALSMDADNVEILAQLAHLYNLLNNYERAAYYIEKVLEINPNHLDCLLLYEEMCLSQNNLIAAKEISERVYEIHPDSKTLAKRINILNKLHDFDKVKALEKSIKDNNDEVLYEIAFAYYENYDIQKAIEILNSAYEKNNKNEKIMLLLGKIYYDSNDFENAKNIYERDFA